MSFMLPHESCRGCGSAACIRDAVGNAHAPEPGRRNIEPAMPGEPGIDAPHQAAVSNFLLRARSIPPVDSRHRRLAVDAQNCSEIGERGAASGPRRRPTSQSPCSRAFMPATRNGSPCAHCSRASSRLKRAPAASSGRSAAKPGLSQRMACSDHSQMDSPS